MPPFKALALLLLTATPALAVEGDARCERWPTDVRVSYEGREAKLFEALVYEVQTHGAAPDRDEVLERFAACSFRLADPIPEQGGDAGAAPNSGGEAGVRAPDFLLEAGRRALLAKPAAGEEAGRRFAMDGELPSAARKLVRYLVRQQPSDTRDTLENRLWVLWIESYVRSLGRFNGYEYASGIAVDDAYDRGRRFAVGFELEVEDDAARVAAIKDPALEQRDVKPGDRVVKLDGKSLGELDHPGWMGYWYADAPFEYEVTLVRSGQAFKVRGTAVVTAIEEVTSTVHQGLGYIRIRWFSDATLSRVRRTLRSFKRQQVDRVVLDLRHNPGGKVSPGLVDLFFRPGQTVMSYKTRRDEPKDIEATVEYFDFPTALLVDGNTVSMAESLTAAFQAHRRGPIVGSRTFGKGVGQMVIPIGDEGELRLVHSTYFFPGTRESWIDAGIEPTHPVELDDTALELLAPYLESGVLRFEQQWSDDPALREADRQLRGQS